MPDPRDDTATETRACWVAEAVQCTCGGTSEDICNLRNLGYTTEPETAPAPAPGDEGCPRCYDAAEGQKHADWCPVWLDQRREVVRQQVALYDEHDGDYDAIITALLHERLASPAPAATEVGEGER